LRDIVKPYDPFARPSPRALWWRRWSGWVIGVAAIVLLGLLIAYLMSGTASTKREVAEAPMLMLPPPPPPPPVIEKPPEPEKPQPEVAEPEPTPVEQPVDDPPPTPTQDIADPVTIDGPAQAGADAFGIGAGRGGGMTGGGLGGITYSRYLASMLQQALARDPRTRKLAFDDIRLDLWLDAEGKPTRVQLVKGTGKPQVDEAVLAMVRDRDRLDQPPPASLVFPQRVSIKGRRP
jgi:protein TonB